MNKKLLCSRQDAASALSVCLRTVDYLISSGKLKTIKIGRRTLVKQNSIEMLARDPRCFLAITSLLSFFWPLSWPAVSVVPGVPAGRAKPD